MSGELERTNWSPDTVAALRLAIMHMAQDVAALREAGDWEALVRGLVPLQDIVSDLRDVERDARMAVADTMPGREVTVDGVARVERKKRTTRRNWDSADLLRRIAFGTIVDPDTGEIMDGSPAEVVDRLVAELSEVAPFTGSMGWRVAALRARGFQIDEWCEERSDGYNIRIYKQEESNE